MPRNLRDALDGNLVSCDLTSGRFSPPNGSRAFVHKRIGGAIGGFLTGGPTGAVGGFFRGGVTDAPVRIVSGKEMRRTFPVGLSHAAEHLWLESMPRSARPFHPKGHGAAQGPSGARSFAAPPAVR